MPDSVHLFVYGTLMSSAAGTMGRAERDRLGRESRLLGPGTIQGRLYDLGRYPGLVESGEKGAIVHGEVVRLADPATSFKWLDAYEGLVPGDHDHNEYARVARPVWLASGEEITAWVYLYRHAAPATSRYIAAGRWPGRA